MRNSVRNVVLLCEGCRENGTRCSAFGMAFWAHLLQVRVRDAAQALSSTRPFRDGRTGQNACRRAPPLADSRASGTGPEPALPCKTLGSSTICL